MQLTATDIARSVICVSVCVLGTRASCAKSVELIEMPFWGLTHVVARKRIIDGGPDPPWLGALLRGHVPAGHSMPTVGECACPTHAADECIRRCRGDRTAMRPLAKSLWTHVSCMFHQDMIN